MDIKQFKTSVINKTLDALKRTASDESDSVIRSQDNKVRVYLEPEVVIQGLLGVKDNFDSYYLSFTIDGDEYSFPSHGEPTVKLVSCSNMIPVENAMEIILTFLDTVEKG